MRKHASVCEYELIHIIRLDGLANGTLKIEDLRKGMQFAKCKEIFWRCASAH